MDKIRVLFVLPENCADETDASDIMLQAFESCRQNVVSVSWIKEAEFHSTDFSKTDFVIFQDFKGKNFESLSQSKCARILGPWCVLVCLMKGIPIPNFTWPIYNVAMFNCVISCSHISKVRKAEIREKVQLMGGCYTDSLMTTTTHLITESVKSEKYLLAAERGLKLYVSKWIDDVWEESQTNNIHCDDKQFEKYKCPPFHNLTISSTGFPTADIRKQVGQLVAKHGGVFTANLVVSTTDVLIVHEESGMLSKKYKAAKAHPNIFCVTVDWIHDSIAKGYAVPHNLYSIKTKETSTPSKENETVPDFSLLSAIGDVTTRVPTVFEESVLPKRQLSTLYDRVSPNKRKCSTGDDDLGTLIDGLDIRKAKLAGQYLDGCSVYLAGFKPDQREKLSKILNLSGATRYDDISDRLTHIIIGDSKCPEVKIIKLKNCSASMVSIHWLFESLEKQKIADEEKFLVNLHDFDKDQFSSPLGKKGLSLLRTNKVLTSDETLKNIASPDRVDLQAEDELMQQYRKSARTLDDSDTVARILRDNSFTINKSKNTTDSSNSKQPETSSGFSQSSEVDDDRTSQETNIFLSKKFMIVNLSVEESQFVKEQIESVFGTVVSKTYKGIPDYVVAPLFVTSPLQVSALEIVNYYWINDSIQEQQELPIDYYHRPFVISEGKPLENCVVAISGYTASERNFLRELIVALGGVSQEQFARVSCDKKKVMASTHLVSLEAEGKKYNAALKWGFPVVAKEWLFECAKLGKLVSEEQFLMGDSKAPARRVFSEVGTPLLNTKRKVSSEVGTPISNTKHTPSIDHARNTPSSGKVFTPATPVPALDININDNTPKNQRIFGGAIETPCTQVTPINKLMEEVRKTNLLGTPQTPPMKKTWYDVDTPESPFGAFIRPHLSPKSKKEIMRYINGIPDFVPPKERRKSTPLSEIKRRCWAKLLSTQESPSQFPGNPTDPSCSHSVLKSNNEDEAAFQIESRKENFALDGDSQTTENAFVNTKLKQIEEMVSAFSENRRSSRTFQNNVPAEAGKSSVESQPFTVGWDYGEESQPAQQVRIFIISGVENEHRQGFVEKIESLGGQVSELNSYDPNCTHLICPKPARNEKTLACIASGKWILHTSYIDKCVSAGKFLPEENFEFGNPRAKDNIKLSLDKESEYKIQSGHWWRKEITRRGYGAFNDMRAIVVANKRDPIIRVIEAGGGQVVDADPPFTEPVHATHCLLEAKSVSDFSVYAPLAQQGIFCINTLYISDFLYRTNKDIKDAVYPHFSRCYS